MQIAKNIPKKLYIYIYNFNPGPYGFRQLWIIWIMDIWIIDIWIAMLWKDMGLRFEVKVEQKLCGKETLTGNGEWLFITG